MVDYFFPRCLSNAFFLYKMNETIPANATSLKLDSILTLASYCARYNNSVYKSAKEKFALRTKLFSFRTIQKLNILIEVCLLLKEQLGTCKKMDNRQKRVISCVKLICKEIKNSTYKI